MRLILLHTILFILCISISGGSADNSTGQPPGNQKVAGDAKISKLYKSRTWKELSQESNALIELGKQVHIPTEEAEAMIIGTPYDDSVASLAIKIWLIDNAKYTVDASYYIFKNDLVGKAFLGALCNAVERGVDVRIMLDSFGSFHPTHSSLKALGRSNDNAGIMINPNGGETAYKARAQTVVFNAISKVFVNHNRRLHDKLLIIDGAYPEHAWIMTGGRNISLAYYGFTADGQKDLSAYKDTEILIRPKISGILHNNLGATAENYFNVLFLFANNKLIRPKLSYRKRYLRLRQDLETLREMPDFARSYESVPDYIAAKLRSAKVRLAHELGNLINRDVVAKYDKNIKKNPNSIMGIMERLLAEDRNTRIIRAVSPYLFIAKYKRKDGTVYYDGKDAIDDWLDRHPDNRIEIVTNSVLTSDNFFAQAIIDMDTAPRLLLTNNLKKKWQQPIKKSELNPELIESSAWKEMVGNPRIKIYQTGKLDSNLLGGDTAYGKLHSKFFLGENVGFVGTTNLDYRSRLFNNEIGYFFSGDELVSDLIEDFELLKSQSYLWGSPEWLAMRAAVREKGGFFKSKWTRGQHATFTRLTFWGLQWLF